MASTLTLNVPSNFNMAYLGQKLQEIYGAQGFTVMYSSTQNNARIQFNKNCGGINLLLGMGQGITANCFLQNEVLTVTYAEGDWTGKIIGFAVGWILCMIPFITAIIGTVNQCSLPNKINNDIMMITSGL